MPKSADRGRRSRTTDRDGFAEGVKGLLGSSPSSRVRRDYARGLRLLRKEGIHSFAALIRALPQLSGTAGWTAIRLLEQRGRRSASALVPVLALADQTMAVEAAKALANLGGARARRGCVRLLEIDAPQTARYAAAYALAMMRDDEAARIVVGLVVDQREDPEIRGQAAEGLDYFGRERGPHRRLAIKTALRGLGDPSPTVRFWCAFALGAMRYSPAVPALTRLARRDRAVCPGWWRVCDEAADAVAVIQGRLPPDRTPAP